AGSRDLFDDMQLVAMEVAWPAEPGLIVEIRGVDDERIPVPFRHRVALVARVAFRVVRLIDGNPAEGVPGIVQKYDLGGVHHDLVREPHAGNARRTAAERRIFMVAVDIERLDLLPEFRFVNRLVGIRALTDAAVALETFSKLSRPRRQRR